MKVNLAPTIRTASLIATCGCIALASASLLIAHPDDPKAQNREARYEGKGWTMAAAKLKAERGGEANLNGPPAFDSDGVTLLSWLPLSSFDNFEGNGISHFAANDCWGHTTPGGKEIAIIGLASGVAFVDVSDPTNPDILNVLPSVTSDWRDMKTFGEYCYAVSEGGGGIQVFDMTQIDAVGEVSIAGAVTTGGTTATHNVAIDTDSGFLYRCGGSSNGLRIYDLNADPVSPPFVGSWTDRYVHDAQIIEMDTGEIGVSQPRQVAFCCAGFNGGFVQTGLSILDVTDKSNITEYAHLENYTSPEYSHQVWVNDDRTIAYLNDELNERDQGLNSTIHVIDISDLTAPFEVAAVDNGLPAITHNVYVKGDRLFASNYRTGLRVFDLTSPTNPQEIAYFDTYPDNDAVGFQGLWSTYPYFDSGVVVGSDLQRGLFVWFFGDPQVEYAFPNGRPDIVSPGGESLQVNVAPASGADIEPGTETLFVDTGNGFAASPLTSMGGDLYEADLPAAECGTQIRYYFSAESTTGLTWTEPTGAPAASYTALVAEDVSDLLADNFESNTGWTPGNLGASSGDWQRGTPVNDPDWDHDPTADGDGSGQAWLTQNEIGNTDVDNGAVELVSPAFDLSLGSDVVAINYDYYLKMTNPAGTDQLLVEASSNGTTGPWETLIAHTTDGGTSWRRSSISPADIAAAGISLTSDMRLRFTANDADPQSIVEAGIDGFLIERVSCEATGPACPADCAPPGGNQVINVDDLLAVINAISTQDLGCDVAPDNGDGTFGNGLINFDDILTVVNAFGACPQ